MENNSNADMDNLAKILNLAGRCCHRLEMWVQSFEMNTAFRHDKAIEYFTYAMECEPSLVDSYVNRASVYYAVNEIRKAESDERRVWSWRGKC